MFGLLVRAYWQLFRFGRLLARGDFRRLHEVVRQCPTRSDWESNASIESICSAVNLASIWQCRQILCLQRSAATTCLLRQHGFPAVLVIGAQAMPFRAHAWVELAGQVVNEKPYMREIYDVLEQC